MNELFDFFDKNVVLLSTSGRRWHGKVAAYTSELDSENGEEEIALRTTEGLIGFSASEIEKIEFVEDSEDK